MATWGLGAGGLTGVLAVVYFTYRYPVIQRVRDGLLEELVLVQELGHPMEDLLHLVGAEDGRAALLELPLVVHQEDLQRPDVKRR